METALKFEGAGKKFGKSVVFDNLDFEVDCGGCLLFAGLNGAGKTTLVKCMLDFCALDSGRVEIFGMPHVARRARARLAYLPERFNPPHYLKGKEFLAYAMTLYGAKTDAGKIRLMMEDLDFDPGALERSVKSYSKGMTQKLGLSACFLSGKDLFVLDEPTSGLDPKAKMLLKAKFLELKAMGRTLFFTSHALVDMADLCDTMIVLHGGAMKFSGSPDSLRKLSAENDLEQGFLNCMGGK